MRELNRQEIHLVNGSGFIGGGFILAPIIAGISNVLLTPTVDIWLPAIGKQFTQLFPESDSLFFEMLLSKIPQSLKHPLSTQGKLFCTGATTYLIARLV